MKKISWFSFLFLCPFLVIMLASCSISKQISRQATKILLKDSAISTGHIGISIYEPATGKYWYEYNADKYFIPASNTKLFTLYAGMKYLGDSLVGLRYQQFSDTAINVFATGDPTFLHPDFNEQGVLDFLKAENRKIYLSANFKENALGYGWAWDDYNDDYMVERSAFPVFGNLVKIKTIGYRSEGIKFSEPIWKTTPQYFSRFLDSIFIIPQKEWLKKDTNELKFKNKSFRLKRNRIGNELALEYSLEFSPFTRAEIPFATNDLGTATAILQTDFHIRIVKGIMSDNSLYPGIPDHLLVKSIHSQPSDSLFKPMMHRSDNFFAEQVLLMASNEHLGYMSDKDMIDTLLKNDLRDVPQKPRWVDGSGLSRYNLFTPKSFVYILNKIKNEFGWERIKNILPTGGEGTLANYYQDNTGFIYAKTGTLSNNCALSGYLTTKKGKFVIFSVLASNYITTAAPVKRSVEVFLSKIRNFY